MGPLSFYTGCFEYEKSARLRTEDRDTRKEDCEQSYSSRDNFVFYPHEEISRFVSRCVRKRIGVREFRDLHALSSRPRLLDLGCCVGWHVICGSDISGNHGAAFKCWICSCDFSAGSIRESLASQAIIQSDSF
jgi:hypothetical protein